MSLRPTYLWVGDWLLVRKAREAIEQAVIAEHGLDAASTVRFDAQKHSAAEVVAEANTLPFFETHRLIRVRQVELWGAEDQARLATYLAEPNATSTLLLTAAKIDGRGKIAKAAKAAGILEELAVPKGAGLRSYVQQQAEALDLRLDGKAVALMVDAFGADPAAILDALERLSLYMASETERRVNVARLGEVLPESRAGETVWKLIDALALRDRKAVLRASSHLLAEREPPLRLVALLLRQIEQLAAVHAALQSQDDLAAAARRAGVPPFKVRDLSHAARGLSAGWLRRAVRVLAELDLQLKRSRRPPELTFEAGLLRLLA